MTDTLVRPDAPPIRAPASTVHVPRPSHATPAMVVYLVVANVVVVTGMWLRHGGLGQLGDPWGWAVALNQLLALYGSLAVLLQLLLISRLPWLERRFGMDSLNHWHRWNGFAATWLLVGHAVLATVGYAGQNRVGLPEQVGDFVLTWPDLLMAMVALGLLVAVAVTSVRVARRELAYETWWFIHLYAYLAVALAFAHQFAVGVDFVDDRMARLYWVTIHAGVIGALLAHRFLVPITRAWRHRLRVTAVVPEGPGVVTVVLTGRGLERLPAASGQFFLLRFLRRDRWWKAHPISLAAAPEGRTLRFGIKALGDDTTALQTVPVGTRVMAEGPYGVFTAAQAQGQPVVLIGGGIGITPLRAMFEDIDRAPGEVTLMYRARNSAEAVYLADLQHIAAARGFDLRVSYSRPDGVPTGGNPFAPQALLGAVPDLTRRHVFVCGPAALIAAATAGLRHAGVPAEQIHAERFDY